MVLFMLPVLTMVIKLKAMSTMDLLDLRKYMTATQAAELIGCTTGRVRQLIKEGKIAGAEKAYNFGWVIPIVEVTRIRDSESATGRPRKNSKKSA